MTAVSETGAVTLLPEAPQVGIPSFESTDTHDRLNQLRDELRTLQRTESTSSLLVNEKVNTLNQYVQNKANEKGKRYLKSLQNGPWQVQPYQVWDDLGPDAVKSRFFLELLCVISRYCEYPIAVEKLNAARDKRKEASRGTHKGVNKKADRTVHDATVVLQAVEQTGPAHVKKRKRDAGGFATTEQDRPPTTVHSSDSASEISIEGPRGKSLKPLGASDVTDTVGDTAFNASVLSDGDANAAPDQLSVPSFEEEDARTLDIPENGLQIPSPHLATPVASDDCVEWSEPAVQIKKHPKPATRALPVSTPTREVIDIDSLPDSPSARIATEPLLTGAIESLHGEHWLSTEAVFRAAKLFNPDILTWYIAEPITTTSDPSVGDRGEARLRLLEDSHQYVVVFVHNRCHWTVGIIDRHDKTIRIYDPLQSTRYINESQQAVQDFARRLPGKCSGPAPEQQWTFDQTPIFPQQDDGFNCGIYAVVFVIFAMLNEEAPRSILPATWREVIACGFKACLGHDREDAVGTDSLRDDPVADISTFGAPIPSADDASVEGIKHEVKGLTVLLNDARLRVENFTMISNLVEKAYQARDECRRRIEEMMGLIKIHLSLLDEPCTNPHRFPLKSSLVSIRQLDSMRKLAVREIAKYRNVAGSAELKRSQLREQAMDAARKDIESW
ncbi:hypothetical protein LTR09_012983 [Extremus antarcticus]|uniref:Ubiquitin-like protease family profile domain-containing protein n=1 Tax=Extremus antarcticus TaxID=702011 RepID=A0AAJ0D968_9PEZI|nr:hypothetical protein LTR09_012983 [Extremus antarcticus]